MRLKKKKRNTKLKRRKQTVLSQIGRQLVLAVARNVLTLEAVGHAVAIGPWQLGPDREYEIVEAVGDDDVVVEADEAVDDDGSVAEAREQRRHVLERICRAHC